MYTAEQYVLWLFAYSIIGWVYETILCSVEQKKFVNRGFLNGPYCPIYGFGAVLDIMILGRIKNPAALFLLGALLTCSLEYLTSYAMEKLFHARWWDYTKRKFNINGRVCLAGAVVFGLFTVVLIMFVQPRIYEFTNMLPPAALHTSVVVLLLIFAADLTVTLVYFTGFNRKLREISAFLEEKRASAELLRLDAAQKLRESAAYTHFSEAFSKKLNHQQRRMIKSFPHLKSVKYDNVLSGFHTLVEKLKYYK